MKVCATEEISDSSVDNELSVSQYLDSTEAEHLGKNFLRPIADHFLLQGSVGKHQCLLFTPLGLNLTQLCNQFLGTSMPKQLVQHTMPLAAMSSMTMKQVQRWWLNNTLEQSLLRHLVQRPCWLWLLSFLLRSPHLGWKDRWVFPPRQEEHETVHICTVWSHVAHGTAVSVGAGFFLSRVSFGWI